MKNKPIPCYLLACAIVLASVAHSFAQGTVPTTSAAATASTSGADDPKYAAFVYSAVSAHVHVVEEPKKGSKTPPDPLRFMSESHESPDGFSATNMPMTLLVMNAYGIYFDRLAGPLAHGFSPGGYDIEAIMDPTVMEALQKLSVDDKRLARQHMLQVLLADQFKLKVHRKTEKISVYELTVAKGGTKFQDAPGPDAGDAAVTMRAENKIPTLTGTNASMADLLPALTGLLRHTVVDKTGLTGVYNFKVEFEAVRGMAMILDGSLPGDRNSWSVPVLDPVWLPDAVQKELGLKLDMKSEPMEIIVVDHYEKPASK
jgi:uncharacterized protein (TIGR03435 family)